MPTRNQPTPKRPAARLGALFADKWEGDGSERVMGPIRGITDSALKI
jgi:hypothetical protein